MAETVISSSVLIAIVIALRFAFRGRIDPRVQYALWLLAALRLLLPFSLFPSTVSILNTVGMLNPVSTLNTVSMQERVVEPAAPHNTRQADLPDGLSGTDETAYEKAETAESAPTINNGAVNTPAETVLSSERNDTGEKKTSRASILVTVWGCGAAAAALWFLLQNLLFYRRLRRTRKRSPVLADALTVYTARVPGPCLFGLLRPAVYIPENASSDERTLGYILTHEAVHYRHGDHIWSFLRCVCLAVHWFNPLVWWAAALSRRDCELACDAGVVRRVGEDNRRDYGSTLIDLIGRRTRPSDLLCGATAMSSGVRGIRERITMLAKKPKTLISTLLLFTLLAAAAVGCTFTGAKNTAVTPVASPAAIPLTQEELAYFNDNQFFCNDYIFDKPLAITNQFLGSLYASPEDIDLFELFYCGSGIAEPKSEEESAAVNLAILGGKEAPCSYTKNSRANIDAVLRQYTGLSLDETHKKGLNKFTYLEAYDAYYYYHGDTNYRTSIHFSGGEREGDIVRLYYTDTFMAQGLKMLTLRAVNGGYQFVSNLQIPDTASGSVSKPVGIINEAANKNAPVMVLSGARSYIRQVYDGLLGKDAAFDNWRIDAITLERSCSELDGRPLTDYQQTPDAPWLLMTVYRIDFAIHTTTQDKVRALLSDGGSVSSDGWFTPDGPKVTYLIFRDTAKIKGQYLFALVDGGAPDSDAFTDKITDWLNTSKSNFKQAADNLEALFADGKTVVWYAGAEESPAQAFAGRHAYEQDGTWQSRYETVFDLRWEKSDTFAAPQGACVCLGDSPDRCFRFYTDSSLVLWQNGGTVTAWRAYETRGGNLPDYLLTEYYSFEADIANLTAPSQAGETAEETLRRFLGNYTDRIGNLSPGSSFSVDDIRVLELKKIQTDGNNITVNYALAAKPSGDVRFTRWGSGNTAKGKDALEGYIITYRILTLTETNGIWRCTRAGADFDTKY